VNERAVLDRPDVRRRLRDSGIVLVRADWTRHDADIAGALSDLGRSGVPTYVFYLPQGPPMILSELLTPGIVFGALDQIQDHAKQEKQVADLAGLKR
jgi:thiol:disulfide interchange protein DsbD